MITNQKKSKSIGQELVCKISAGVYTVNKSPNHSEDFTKTREDRFTKSYTKYFLVSSLFEHYTECKVEGYEGQ